MNLDVNGILKKRRKGERISEKDCITLMRSNALSWIGSFANEIKEEIHGSRVYYRNDLNINYTNICINLCPLCSFGRPEGSNDGYIMALECVEERVRDAVSRGINEFHVVGGLCRRCGLGYVEDLLKRIKYAAPGSFIQGITAVEVEFLARVEGLAVDDVLKRLKRAGLGSMPGGGAEIFHPDVRKVISPRKISGEQWLEIHRIAHTLGIVSNATMLFGHIERVEHRVDHMRRVRDLQDETGGFRAFVPLPFHPLNTPLSKMYDGLSGPTGWECLMLAACARVFFDNIEHIKLVWQGVGKKVAQVSLGFGVDDIGGASFEERIFDSAGGKTFTPPGVSWLPQCIREAGRRPVYRSSAYTRLGEVRG